MSKDSFSSGQYRFIEEVACLLIPSGMPATAARIYGYLLVNAEPVTLDEMAGDLEISKSSASVAARLLEKHGMARRHSERGSKRVRYSLPESFSGFLSEQCVVLGKLGSLFQDSAATVTSGSVNQRLLAMSRFYLAMRDVITAALAEFAGGDPG